VNTGVRPNPASTSSFSPSRSCRTITLRLSSHGVYLPTLVACQNRPRRAWAARETSVRTGLYRALHVSAYEKPAIPDAGSVNPITLVLLQPHRVILHGRAALQALITLLGKTVQRAVGCAFRGVAAADLSDLRLTRLWGSVIGGPSTHLALAPKGQGTPSPNKPTATPYINLRTKRNGAFCYACRTKFPQKSADRRRQVPL